MLDADPNSPPKTLREPAEQSQVAAAIESVLVEPHDAAYTMDELQLLALASR